MTSHYDDSVLMMKFIVLMTLGLVLMFFSLLFFGPTVLGLVSAGGSLLLLVWSLWKLMTVLGL